MDLVSGRGQVARAKKGLAKHRAKHGNISYFCWDFQCVASCHRNLDQCVTSKQSWNRTSSCVCQNDFRFGIWSPSRKAGRAGALGDLAKEKGRRSFFLAGPFCNQPSAISLNILNPFSIHFSLEIPEVETIDAGNSAEAM